ncbi:MAG: DUF4375 domain-containing protein [Bacteroidia bacterium]|nr:DUF4375 domain-containing protein [Bacteroidia bacterium]
MTRDQALRHLSNPNRTEAAIALQDFVLSFDGSHQFTTAQNVVFVVNELTNQVMMNGLAGFFYNYSGEVAPRAAQSLAAIGAIETANRFSEIMLNFGIEPYPVDTNERRLFLEKFDYELRNDWNEFEEWFFAFTENIEELTLSYIASNIDNFLGLS